MNTVGSSADKVLHGLQGNNLTRIHGITMVPEITGGSKKVVPVVAFYKISS